MSVLINQPELTAVDRLLEEIAGGKRRIPEGTAHELGLDVAVLQAQYEIVKPLLDYVLGYVDIVDLDPVVFPRPGFHHLFRGSGIEPWNNTLNLANFMTDEGSKYRQVVPVFSRKLWHVASDKSDIFLMVLLARKNRWIVWSNLGPSIRHDTEKIKTFSTVLDMCRYIDTLVTEGYRVEYQSSPIRRLPEYVPLRIADGLVSIIEDTIMAREKHLASFKQAQHDAIDSLKLIDY